MYKAPIQASNSDVKPVWGSPARFAIRQSRIAEKAGLVDIQIKMHLATRVSSFSMQTRATSLRSKRV
jgi:hypothetical protein